MLVVGCFEGALGPKGIEQTARRVFQDMEMVIESISGLGWIAFRFETGLLRDINGEVVGDDFLVDGRIGIVPVEVVGPALAVTADIGEVFFHRLFGSGVAVAGLRDAGMHRPLALVCSRLAGITHPDDGALLRREGRIHRKDVGQHGAVDTDGRLGQELAEVAAVELMDGLAGEGRFFSQDGITEECLLRQTMPLEVMGMRKAGRSPIGKAEIEGTVAARAIPAALLGVPDQVLAAQEVRRIGEVHFPDDIVVGDGHDLVVRDALRHPVAAPHYGADPAFVPVRDQIAAAIVGIAVFLDHLADDPDAFAGAAGFLGDGDTHFIKDGAAGLPVFENAAETAVMRRGAFQRLL